MSEHQSNSLVKTQTKLQICLLATQPPLADLMAKLMNEDCYELKSFNLMEEAVDFAIEHSAEIDCLVLSVSEGANLALKRLWSAEVLLPAVIIEAELAEPAPKTSLSNCLTDFETSSVYHEAEIRLYPTQLKEINSYIQLAINKFISLAAEYQSNTTYEQQSSVAASSSPNSELEHVLARDNGSNSTVSTDINLSQTSDSDLSLRSTRSGSSHSQRQSNRILASEMHRLGIQKSLLAQQRRLIDKLKQRMSHMGFFYKRNPKSFWSNLASEEQQKLIDEIRQSYRQILLIYFDEDSSVEGLIDRLVDRAFFADISTSQIIEIHMDLIDNFAYQLKIEGRNEDILLDYRLPLIDIVSHLCEIYRRSIPESDVPMNLLFAVE